MARPKRQSPGFKRIVFCFDGTWNRLDAVHPTNVVITAESILPLAPDGTAQLIFYDEGVGTDQFERLRGGLFGAGLVKNIADAYRFLIFNHTPGDQIYVFGFSRGAYTARSFVGLLRNCGILRRRDAGKVNEAIKLYQSRAPAEEPDSERMFAYRKEHAPQLCVSAAEDAWRCRNVEGYSTGAAPLLEIAFLGVWDTVGSLGIPERYRLLNFINTKYRFHDTRLSRFVKSARHALAIDERRKEFGPSPWENFESLNQEAGFALEAGDAPYQQVWFPGTHGSVGGGGDRRGLSDQALDWVLDGSRLAGLKLDSSHSSRIYELAPSYREHLDNMSPVKNPSLMSRAMALLPAADRTPGPTSLFQVSMSARRRWVEAAENLPERKPYRPPTLDKVRPMLDAIEPATVGVGLPPFEGDFDLHEVGLDDTLGTIAKAYLGDSQLWPRIYDANRDRIENPDRIYTGQSLRIPRP